MEKCSHLGWTQKKKSSDQESKICNYRTFLRLNTIIRFITETGERYHFTGMMEKKENSVHLPDVKLSSFLYDRILGCITVVIKKGMCGHQVTFASKFML